MPEPPPDFQRILEALSNAKVRFVVIGGTIFKHESDSGPVHFLVVRPRFAATLELTRNRLLFIHEEHHDVDGGMTEVNAQRGAEKFTAKRMHLVDKEFKTFDLNIRARKSINDDTGMVLLSQELPQQQIHHFPVSDHDALVLECLGFRRIQQGTDDNRRTSQAASLADERGIGTFTGTRRPAKKDDFLGKS